MRRECQLPSDGDYGVVFGIFGFYIKWSNGFYIKRIRLADQGGLDFVRVWYGPGRIIEKPEHDIKNL